MGPMHRKASLQEYHDLPWQLGYKHEYYGGKIHVSVSHAAVVTLRLPLQPRTPVIGARPLRSDDLDALLALYWLSLRQVPEFIEYPAAAYRKTVRQAVAGYLEKVEQPWFSAARVMAERRVLTAAAFLVPTRLGPILQPIFVRPNRWRRGLGSQVLHHVENRLLEMGATHLYSNCHLANASSLAWHHRYGFEELPDVSVAAFRLRYFSHELERRRRLRQITDAEAAVLEQERARWQAEHDRLEKIQEADFRAAHPGMALWRGD